jgi:tetratricopeptide (TPR) repeat protein
MTLKLKKSLRWVTVFTALVTLWSVSGEVYRLRLQHLDRQARENYLVGRQALADRDYSKALPMIEAYLRRNPGDATALYEYAQAREQVAEPEDQHLAQAIRLYDRFLKSEPDHVEARRRLLHLYMRSGLSTDALLAADELLVRVPGDPATYRAMAVASARLKRNEDALRFSKRYNSVVPGELSGQVMTLRLMLRCGRPAADVRRRAAKLRETNPADPRFELLCGMAASMTADSERARCQARCRPDNNAPPASAFASAPPAEAHPGHRVPLVAGPASNVSELDLTSGDNDAAPHGASLRGWRNVRLDPKDAETIQDLLDELDAGPPDASMREKIMANGDNRVFVDNATVPLPPAAWAGLSLLGCVCAFRLRTSRRAS